MFQQSPVNSLEEELRQGATARSMTASPMPVKARSVSLFLRILEWLSIVRSLDGVQAVTFPCSAPGHAVMPPIDRSHPRVCQLAQVKRMAKVTVAEAGGFLELRRSSPSSAASGTSEALISQLATRGWRI
jgi:hypothetical protein